MEVLTASPEQPGRRRSCSSAERSCCCSDSCENMKPGDDEETGVTAQSTSRDAEFLNVWLMNSSSLEVGKVHLVNLVNPSCLLCLRRSEVQPTDTSACQTADSAHFRPGRHKQEVLIPQMFVPREHFLNAVIRTRNTARSEPGAGGAPRRVSSETRSGRSSGGERRSG